MKGEVKSVKCPKFYDLYAPRDGAMGTVLVDYDDSSGTLVRRRMVDWHACRETFHDDNMAKQSMYWYMPTRTIVTKVRRFIAAIEDRLRRPKSDRAEFCKTNNPKVWFIRLGRFWSTQAARELFTILLRTGTQFKTSINNCLRAPGEDDYARQTYDAIQHFLAGNVRWAPTNPFHGFAGWVDEAQEDNLIRYLKKPKRRCNGRGEKQGGSGKTAARNVRRRGGVVRGAAVRRRR